MTKGLAVRNQKERARLAIRELKKKERLREFFFLFGFDRESVRKKRERVGEENKRGELVFFRFGAN